MSLNESSDYTIEDSNQVPESAIRWLRRKLHRGFSTFTLEQLSAFCDDQPEVFTDEKDECYRDGFEEGFDYAIECMDELYRKKGFVRTREIANILWDWSERVLRPWRWHGKGKIKWTESEFHYPMFKHESWAEIRERIIRRDKKCTRCGDVLKLEVDHITDVQHGGRPVNENLRTLCAVCHKGKSIWDIRKFNL